MNADKGVIAVVIVWLIGVLLTLAFWGVVAWGIIKTVTHITSGG